MKLSVKFILAIFLILNLSSCHLDSGNTRKGILYTSGGKTSEILVVINNNLWNSSLGDTIKSTFQDVKPWFAQSEPSFDISHIPNPAFQNVYQKYRNIIIIKINPEILQNQFKARKNVFAKPQILIEFKCKSKEDFNNLLSLKANDIARLFHENELNRIEAVYRGLNVDSVSKAIHKKFGFSMVFPRGFYIAENKADFAWVRKVTPKIEEGILIYTKPYSDTLDFDYRTIINYRNTITKAYIPGPVDGSYMKVSSVFPPFHQTTDFHGNYATLLRSWWDVEGYPMGGPFLSYTFVDTSASRLITIDGYIKAYKEDKRDLLLHLESIMWSFAMDAVKP